MEISLQERDKKVIWHPYTHQKHASAPIPIIQGEGVYLIDDKGNRYIDAISSWWVNVHGHAHPYIAGKIYEQAKKLEHVIFAGFTHQPAIELAERLLDILPGSFSKIFYSDNGSTATEVAIKMALQYWWNRETRHKGQGTRIKDQEAGSRTKILALNNSYHGDTFGAMSISDRSVFTLAFHDKLFEVIFIDPPVTKSPFPIHDFAWDEIACFIYEPLLQGAGGMKMFSAESLNKLIKKCKQYNIICIADEVMTGFGRTGKLFASEYIEEKPDIICLSKGLTGGTMALGVTACTQEIYSAFVDDDKLKTFFHGHSFTANPLACTAAFASLNLLQKEECLQNIEFIARQHQAFLQQLQIASNSSATIQTKNHRQLGTIIAFEIETGEDEYLNNISQLITQKALNKGIFIRPLGNTVYIMPPYCITEEQLQKVYNAILEILQDA